MEPPDDAIETRAATIWVEDGILISRSTGVPATTADIMETVGVVRDLTKGSRLPSLFDARKWPGPGSYEGQVASVRNVADSFTAMAMLIDAESPPPEGHVREAVDRLMFPFRLFTDEAEALAFLQGFLPREQPMTEPPEDAVETTTGTVWLKDGIIIERSKGVPTTSETVGEIFGVLRDLSGGVPAPLLWDARKWPGGDVETWTTAFAELKSTLTAVALLVEPESSVGTGPFFLDRMPAPFQVFTDETEALAFLREFIPDE